MFLAVRVPVVDSLRGGDEPESGDSTVVVLFPLRIRINGPSLLSSSFDPVMLSSSLWSSPSLSSSLSTSELPCSSCSSGGELNGLLLAGEIILTSCFGISTLSLSFGCEGCNGGLIPLLLDDSGRTTTAASLQISSRRDWRDCRTIVTGVRGRTACSGWGLWVGGGSGVWPGSGGTIATSLETSPSAGDGER